MDVETIGELPQQAARRYAEGLLKVQSAPVLLAKDWGEIWMVCGGSVGLLKLCLQSAASYSSLDSGARIGLPVIPTKPGCRCTFFPRKTTPVYLCNTSCSRSTPKMGDVSRGWPSVLQRSSRFGGKLEPRCGWGWRPAPPQKAVLPLTARSTTGATHPSVLQDGTELSGAEAVRAAKCQVVSLRFTEPHLL